MAFIRAVFYYLFVAVGLFLVGIPFMFYKGVLCRRWADSTRVCIPFFNVLFKLSGIKVEIVGKENIPNHKNSCWSPTTKVFWTSTSFGPQLP